ncbi:hypothetical protein EDB92DRAFT_1842038 [Lactarius akahatsu]|uniref:Uncharacterized protein n=1 Tax=Lactarius akahatsu TaxID=416441 RepID=A0AAD4QG95_9AGAM|nr:hypothetical protein EDB92DRAFT_1842038 [Lactarius akahatsu]
MQLLFGDKAVWEAYTPLLSPLEALKSLPSPFGVLEYPHAWQIPTSLFGSEHDSDLDSDDGTASSLTLHEPEDVAPVDWGATLSKPGLSQLPCRLEACGPLVTTRTAAAANVRTRYVTRSKVAQHPDPTFRPTGRWSRVAYKIPVCKAVFTVPSAPRSPRGSARLLVRRPSRTEGTDKRRNYGPEDWLSSGDPKKRAEDDDALSTCAVYAEREDNRLLWAPLLRTVALPDEEESNSAASEEFLYGGPDLGGWLTGTFDGVPKMVTLEHLNLAVPVAFPAEERLLAFPGVELGRQEYGVACE